MEDAEHRSELLKECAEHAWSTASLRDIVVRSDDPLRPTIIQPSKTAGQIEALAKALALALEEVSSDEFKAALSKVKKRDAQNAFEKIVAAKAALENVYSIMKASIRKLSNAEAHFGEGASESI